jgi:hypothetical protein
VAPPRGRPLRERAEALVGPLAVVAEVEGWDLLGRLVGLGVGATVALADVPAPAGVAVHALADGLETPYYAVFREDDPRIDALLAALLAGPR